MRLVLDTNVFISAVFFRGVAHRILSAWRDRWVGIVFSPAIFEEYQRVGQELARQFPGVDLSPFLVLLLTTGQLCRSTSLPARVCVDPDDDKFLARALEGRCRTIVSGDSHLVNASGYHGITVWRPRQFIDRFLPLD